MSMNSLPILFSAPMVRALLAGTKTQTRRLSRQWLKVKEGDELWVRETFAVFATTGSGSAVGIGYAADHPTGNLAETDGGYNWRSLDMAEDRHMAKRIINGDRWKPSIHMPRWASRITLVATADARLERLQDISEADAVAEGISEVPGKKGIWDGGGPAMGNTPQIAYMRLWDSLHGKKNPWSSNPEVCVISFRVKEPT